MVDRSLCAKELKLYYGLSFLNKIKPDRQRQIVLVRIIGHSPLSMPKTVQSAKPMTVNVYIRNEIAAVSLVFAILMTCARKLETEQAEAI